MRRLEGRVAVVTGAGRGIGASVARLLGAEGAAVVVNDLGVALDGSGRDPLPAEQVVKEITESGGTAVADGGDVADFESAKAMVRNAVETFGKLDVLVNVAGILRDRMVFNMNEAEWDAVIRVHLRGTFNTIRHASEYWRRLRDEQAQHRIINFTSGSGLHGAPGQANYAAAKMGIVGLTYSCANALAPYGVTANAIAPGAATRMTESVPLARSPGSGSDPERSPDNVAPVAVYLASEASGWCSGQVLSASGYQVGLYSTPQIVRQLSSPGPWDLGRLSEMLERVFKPAVAASSAGSPIPRARAARTGAL